MKARQPMPIDSTPGPSIALRRDFLRDLDAGAQADEPPDDAAQTWPAPRQKAIAVYRQGIEILHSALDTDIQAHERAQRKLRQFGDFVAGGIQDGFQDDVRDQFLNQAHKDFALFCTLVQKPTLPQEARRQAILKLTEGFDVCAPAVAQHIQAATRELQALGGVARNFAHGLTSAIEQQIQAFMRQHQVCKHAGNEIHYVALFFNQVADHFGLPQRTDALLPKDVAQTLLDAGARHVVAAGPVERVITHMAEDYLARIEDFQAAYQQSLRAASMDLLSFDALHRQFHADLKPRLDSMFGPVDDEFLFQPSLSSADERYGLTSDITLIARAIARNLRAADAVAFKPAYVMGAPGEGIKLKQLGESLFYVSQTRKSADDGSVDENLHQHQTLDRFVLEDLQRGRQLLGQLDQLALAPATMPAAKAAQQDFWQKMPAALYREMKDAPGPPQSTGLLRQTMALLDSDAARNRLALAMLNQATAADSPEFIDGIFRQLSHTSLALDDHQCHAALEHALKLGNTRFAKEMIPQIPSAVLSIQDSSGYTLLMHALECDQTDAAGRLVQTMGPEQLILQETDGNTALVGTLIKGQTELAAAIIKKLNGQQLNVQNAEGHTPLMLALMHGQPAAASDILDKLGRKQLKVKAYDGQGVREIARGHGQAEIAAIIRDKQHFLWSRFYR